MILRKSFVFVVWVKLALAVPFAFAQDAPDHYDGRSNAFRLVVPKGWVFSESSSRSGIVLVPKGSHEHTMMAFGGRPNQPRSETDARLESVDEITSGDIDGVVKSEGGTALRVMGKEATKFGSLNATRVAVTFHSESGHAQRYYSALEAISDNQRVYFAYFECNYRDRMKVEGIFKRVVESLRAGPHGF